MRRSSALALLVTWVSLAAAVGQPPPPAAHPDAPKGPATGGGVAALSPESRQLFRLEMAGLQGAMLELLPAVIAGDRAQVAAVGERIESGFVLAQNLTAEQREELHRVLSAEFLERDRAFHELAGGLVSAARSGRPETTTFYVYKLTESCVDCHSRHARERFPAFTESAGAPAPHHH